MKTHAILTSSLLLLASSVQIAQAAESMSLAGDWGVLLDPQNNNEAMLSKPEGWAAKETLPFHFPGSIQSQKIGDLPSARSPWTARIGLAMLNNAKYLPYQKEGDGGGFKTPFWLTPDRVYVGSAWFRRDIDIPAIWKDQRILLTLERPHWETTVFLNGKQVGRPLDSLGTPHVHDLTDVLGTSPAGKHTLIIRVDNRVKIPVGPDASSVTDQTQSNWNGIVGDIELATTPRVYIDDVQIFPDLANKKVHVKVAIGNTSGLEGSGPLTCTVAPRGKLPRLGGGDITSNEDSLIRVAKWDKTGTKIEFDYDMSKNVATWDKFNPNLYEMALDLRPIPPGGPVTRTPDNRHTDWHSRITAFGMREVTTKGPQLLLNGHPIMLRGTLECCIFPLTGYPPTGPDGAAYWKKIYTQLKAFGLNHLRFHSWCPPEIAFQVADEMGIYLQIEGSAWAAFGSSGLPATEPAPPDAGGRRGAALDNWIVRETDAMLKAYGNHPSFLLMSTANEPGSRTNQPNAAFLSALLTKWKAADPRHLYTAGSNWPNVPEANYQVMSQPRMNGSGELTRPPQTTSDYSRIVAQYPNQPVISHETGQWCVYPNFDEIKKYTGTLHPGNLEIFKDFLDKAGMGEGGGDQAHDFLMATGKFQTLLYKEEIEALLRTPNIGGFQLLDLHDFPGQGTAPVGVLDAFWDEKPYVTAAEYKLFAGPVVPLALMPKRIFTADETPTVLFKVSNFTADNIPTAAGRGVARWRLIDSEGTPIDGGDMNSVSASAGKLSDIGEIKLTFEKVRAPAKLKLQLNLMDVIGERMYRSGRAESTGPSVTNDWEIWIYPTHADTLPPQNVTVVNTAADAMTALDAGKRVLLLPAINAIAGNTQGSFAPIFWNRITFPTAQYHTLSILCDPKHPAFKDFPTDFYSNWQWSELQQRGTCKPMLLGGLPKELKPIVQFIDDWDQARKLGLIIEAKVGGNGGGGKLILCSIDLSTNLNTRPVARQLLASLQTYMASPTFNPPVALTEAQLRTLLQGP